MPSKADIEKRIATMGDPKSNGAWREFVEKNNAADIAEQKRQLRIANHTKQQWGIADKKNDGVKYVGSRQHLYDEKPDSQFKKLVKYGVENSSVPVSKAPQGSKQHKTDILNYVNKVVADNEPKIADQEIFKNNINRQPKYPTQASPRQIGDLAEKLEKQRQMTGGTSLWDDMKATAKTPAEKKEIRETIWQDYKRNGAKNMAEADLRWIGKSKYAPVADFKIDASGISDSINNYIKATQVHAPTELRKKERDPDLSGGLAAILGVPYEN